MTRPEVLDLINRVFDGAVTQLCGPSFDEYSTTENFTSNFDAHYSLYGEDAALSQASEKLYRYRNKGNPQDLIKAIGWIILLLSKDETYKTVTVEKDGATTSSFDE